MCSLSFIMWYVIVTVLNSIIQLGGTFPIFPKWFSVKSKINWLGTVSSIIQLDAKFPTFPKWFSLKAKIKLLGTVKTIAAYIVVMNTDSDRNIKVIEISLYRLMCLTLICEIIIIFICSSFFGLTYCAFLVCLAIVSIDKQILILQIASIQESKPPPGDNQAWMTMVMHLSF